MEQIRFWLFVLAIGIIFSCIVILIAHFQKKRVFAKYIPAIILFALGAACLVKARWFSEGMEGLGFVIFAMMLLGGGILTLITAVVVDIINKKRNHTDDLK